MTAIDLPPHLPPAPRFLAGEDCAVESHIADAMPAAHAHDHVEINLLFSGSMTYRFADRELTVPAGRLSIFWAAIPHQSVAVPSHSRIVCAYLPVADLLALPIGDGVRRALADGGFIVSTEPDEADAILFPRWAAEWQGADPARRRLVRDELGQRLRRAALGPHALSPLPRPPAGEAPRPPAPGPLDRDRAERIARFIDARFTAPVSLDEVARAVGVHAATAAASFRRVFGVSVHRYVLDCRLARARSLLAETDLPIIDIAFDCGFGSLPRFYAAFTRSTDVPPGQYRRLQGRG